MTWRFGHEWSLQISRFVGNSGALSLLAPDGSGYDFEFRQGGSIIRKSASGDANLSFVNTYGADVRADEVKAGGGTFVVRTSENEEIEIALYVPRGEKEYLRGRPTKITFQGGYSWTMSYGTHNELSRIEDSFGRSLSFTWNLFQPPGEATSYPVVVSKIALPDGTSLRYLFELSNGDRVAGLNADRLYKVERQSATGAVLWSESYHYESPTLIHALTGVTDSRGIRYLTREYDSFSRVVSTSHPGGADKVTIEYSDSPDKWFAIRTVTNPLGKKTVYKFKRGSN